MFDKALVGLDFSPISDKLIEWLPYLKKLGTRKILLLHVIPETIVDHAASGIFVDKLIEEETRRTKELFTRYTEFLTRRGFVVDQLEPEVGHPAAYIAKIADKVADFIVVGGKGHSWLREILLGSTVEELLRLAIKPVMVVKGFEQERGSSPSLPLDPFSSTVIAAVDVLRIEDMLAKCIIELASRARPPRLILLYVDEHGIGSSEAESRIRSLLQQLRARGIDPILEVAGGQPAKTILRSIERYEASLVIMGGHGSGESKLRGLLLGTTTDVVVRYSPIPVLVCKGS